MTNAIVTFKIMPSSKDEDLSRIKEESTELIDKFTEDGEKKTEEEPMAFGLKALKVIFVMDEDKGGTDELEKKIEEEVEGVQSVEVTDVRRAIE